MTILGGNRPHEWDDEEHFKSSHSDRPLYAKYREDHDVAGQFRESDVIRDHCPLGDDYFGDKAKSRTFLNSFFRNLTKWVSVNRVESD